MIVSHEKKYVFVKTTKVGSSSLELVLSRYCGPADIITPNGDEDERMKASMGGRPAQNHHVPFTALRGLDLARVLVGKERPHAWVPHTTAAQAKRRLGEPTWSDYFTFSIIRNPFDAAVSRFFWRHRGQAFDDVRLAFNRWLRRTPHLANRNWHILTDDQERLLVDEVLRYEDLDAGLRRVAERLQLPEDLPDQMRGTRAKSGHRKRDHYRDVIDDDARALLEVLCRPELETFGYTF